MNLIFTLIPLAVLAIFLAAVFVDGSFKYRKYLPMIIFGVMVVILVLSTRVRQDKEAAAQEEASQEAPVVGAFKSCGLRYPLRYDAQAGTIIFSEDLNLLRRMMDDGNTIVVVIGAEGRLGCARRVSTPDGTDIYEIAGEPYTSDGTPGAERALLRRMKRSGIRFIEPETGAERL